MYWERELPLSLPPWRLWVSIHVLLGRALLVMNLCESKHGLNTPRKGCSQKKSPCKFFRDVRTPFLIYFWWKSGFFQSYLLKEKSRFTSTNSSEFCSTAKVNCHPSFKESWDSKPRPHLCGKRGLAQPWRTSPGTSATCSQGGEHWNVGTLSQEMVDGPPIGNCT